MVQKIIFISLFLSSILTMKAQETHVFTDVQSIYERANHLYDNELYGQAQLEFQQLINIENRHKNGQLSNNILERSKLYHAMSAIKLNRPDGEQLILDFIKNYETSPVVHIAKRELGDYYYASQQYDKVISFMGEIKPENLRKNRRYDFTFKLAYAYFVRKNNEKARALFGQIKHIEEEYYYPSNYYYGVTAFFQDDYPEALQAFKLVDASKKYSRIVPYYITQIYFAEKQYQEVIDYASPLVQNAGIRYALEINKLVGNAWFELGQYDRALPYLAKYHQEAARITEKEAYQLAYTQYLVGQYESAITNFEELRNIDSKIGQNALYNLADSYIRTGQKNTARNAFLTASKMTYDPSIQEICNFNYAKLSFELGNDRDAIRTLQTIPYKSSYYESAQALLGKIYVNSKDYQKALEYIEKTPKNSLQMQKAYQQVTYYRGVELFNENDLKNARQMFNKSLKRTPDLTTEALALYWLAEVNYAEQKYDTAIQKYGQFIGLARGIRDLPEEATEHTANYNIGYAYLKKNNYAEAAQYFQDAVNGLRLNYNNIKNTYVIQHVLPDATIRAADAFFKENNYNKALEFYDNVIQFDKHEGKDYARYQKAIIIGLQYTDEPIEGILALEELYQKYPNSEYADNAIYNSGIGYANLEKYNAAADVFEKLLNRYPQSEYTNPARLKLALAYINLDKYNAAAETYKDIFNNNPTPQEAQSALEGIESTYGTINKTEKYIEFVNQFDEYKLTEIEQENAMISAADVHFDKKSYLLAANAYGKYLKAFPASAGQIKAHFRRAESYFFLKDYNKAFGDYEIVIDKGASTYLEEALERAAAIAYNQRQDFDAALRFYEILMPFKRNDEKRSLEPYFGVVRSAYRAEKLKEYYDLATNLQKDSRLTEREQAEIAFYIAKTANQENDLDRALAYFTKVKDLTNDVRAAESRYEISNIYYKKRNLDVAQALALETNKQSARFEYWVGKSVVLLGSIFIDKKDYFNAKATLESIVENYPKNDDVKQAATEKLAQIEQLEKSESRIVPENTPDSDNLDMDDPE